jgi:hypothetical protein
MFYHTVRSFALSCTRWIPYPNRQPRSFPPPTSRRRRCRILQLRATLADVCVTDLSPDNAYSHLARSRRRTPSPQLPRHRIRSPAQERGPATTTCSLRTLPTLSATAPLRHLCCRTGHIPTSPRSCAHTATPCGRSGESTMRDDVATDACCPHPQEYLCSFRSRSSRQRRRARDSPTCAALRVRVRPSSSAAQLRTAHHLHKLTLRA